MQTELDALRLILAKEHSFSSKMRYLSPDHDTMVPLLIYFGEYFKQKERMSQEEKRAIRLKIINNICESSYESFYQMTSWQAMYTFSWAVCHSFGAWGQEPSTDPIIPPNSES